MGYKKNIHTPRLILLLIAGGIFLSFNSQRPDICQVYGTMYETDNAREADFLVYEEESEAFCDIIVYEEDNKLFADKPGLWHFINKKDFADFKIYFTKDKGKADFSVYFIENESFAGCNKR